MTKLKDTDLAADCLPGGPQSALERKFLEEYLERKGQSLSTISALPEEEAKALMKEACSYASLKLAEIESRAHLRASIHMPEH
jgi:hypothetical protein